VAGQGSQHEIADRWRIDRSTVVHIVKPAKQGGLERLATSEPGRPGLPAWSTSMLPRCGDLSKPSRGI
jgi:hypothetical protein